jgi:hypothetical protein
MILDRAAIISMNRKLPDEVVKDFDSIVVGYIGTDLHDRLQHWSINMVDETLTSLPKVPDGLRDRQRDIWRPLLTVAELACEDPGEPWQGAWPEAARMTCEAKCEAQTVDDDESSLGKRLLRDIRSVFDEWGTETASGDGFVKTLDLVDYLKLNDEFEWNEKEYGQDKLNASKLARYLKTFQIKSRTIAREDDPNGKRPKVFYESQFHDVWTRYLSGEDGEDQDS